MLLWYKQIYSYSGVLEALSGMPFDVKFISFDDLRKDASILNDVDVLINVGDAYTAFSGGEDLIRKSLRSCAGTWMREKVLSESVNRPPMRRRKMLCPFTMFLGVDRELGLYPLAMINITGKRIRILSASN